MHGTQEKNHEVSGLIFRTTNTVKKEIRKHISTSREKPVLKTETSIRTAKGNDTEA